MNNSKAPTKLLGEYNFCPRLQFHRCICQQGEVNYAKQHQKELKIRRQESLETEGNVSAGFAGKKE